MNLEGRNEIRFNNAGGKCLLENWVEERATQHLEATDINSSDVNCAQVHRNGHKGLLTLQKDAKAAKNTTVGDSYRPPTFPQVATVGRLERSFYEQTVNQVRAQMIQAQTPSKPSMESKSVKQSDFDNDDFEFIPPKPKTAHNLYGENQISFWADHTNNIHGVSQQKVANFPFRKNTAFSKPYTEYHGEDLPHAADK